MKIFIGIWPNNESTSLEFIEDVEVYSKRQYFIDNVQFGPEGRNIIWQEQDGTLTALHRNTMKIIAVCYEKEIK